MQDKITPLRNHSRRELIELLEISPRTFDRRLKAGRIIKSQTEGGARYQMAEVDRFGRTTGETSSSALAYLVDRLEASQREVGRLTLALEESREQHERLWEVVGDLTVEALELERQLTSCPDTGRSLDNRSYEATNPYHLNILQSDNHR